MTYHHPLYTPESVAAQRLLPTLDDDRVVFAGAYHGWGFHEDGAASGLRAARACAGRRPRPDRGVRMTAGTPAIYRTRITHVRARAGAPLLRVPRIQLVRRPRRAAARCRDGCGRSPGSMPATTSTGAEPIDTLRHRVDAFLADNGITCRGGRITALLQARVLGYVFNPLSLFWCHDADGVLRAVIAEVHNTYGQRHAYLLAARRDSAPRWSRRRCTCRRSTTSTATTWCGRRDPDDDLDVTHLAAPRQPARVRRDHARPAQRGRRLGQLARLQITARWPR